LPTGLLVLVVNPICSAALKCLNTYDDLESNCVMSHLQNCCRSISIWTIVCLGSQAEKFGIGLG
jgi:hypothetical protein